MSGKKRIALTEIFAVIDEDDKLIGYFKTMEAVERYLEKEAIDHVTILTVIKVEDAEYPPEPMLEFIDRKLEDVLWDH